MDKIEAEKILKQYSEPTRRQHYVKMEYLFGWTKDKKTILAKIKGSNDFRKYGLTAVCVKKDFYRVYHHFNNVELSILRNYFADDNKLVSLSCEEEIKNWQNQTLKTTTFKKLFPDQSELINNFEIQSGEQYQTQYENYFYEIVNDYIKYADSSFLDDPSLKAKFLVGVSNQYLRTYGFHSRLVAGTNNLIENYPEVKSFLDTNQLSMITGRIFAIKMAYMLSLIKPFKIEFLKNNSSSYLTSDMPIVQIGKRDDKGNAVELLLFFPVNPHLAILFPSKNGGERNISKKESDMYNNMTINNSYNYLFREESDAEE